MKPPLLPDRRGLLWQMACSLCWARSVARRARVAAAVGGPVRRGVATAVGRSVRRGVTRRVGVVRPAVNRGDDHERRDHQAEVTEDQTRDRCAVAALVVLAALTQAGVPED